MTDKANTAAQIAAHKAAEKAWAEESTWPLFQVEIEGDDVEWVPRPDERYWKQSDPDDPASPWIPKSGKAVVMPAKATVTCHARSEEHAKMLALRDNPTYHTVKSVKKVKGA